MNTTKTKRLEGNFRRMLRKLFRPPTRKHDSMLVLNMLDFNFTGGWSRTFSANEDARSYA
jgi:hypothetical protein